uniref:cation transporting ATPase C-terminal domain-containing protein n=1 Tax=Marinobacter sp. TaxID=50741 RepID=UPI003568379E
SGGEWVSQGDIVDIAFLVMAKKLDMSITDLRTRQEQVALIPYESEKAYSGVVNRVGDQTVIYAKGSPEKMLAMCNRMATADGSTDIDKPALESQFTELASRGYRIIALAKKTSSSGDHEMADMIFLGMVAMIDPLRHEAFDAIEKCRTGGIEVAMVTFFFCVLAGLPMPMIAVQLLWLNLVANGFQDVALAFEPKEGGELSVKPRSPQEPVFDKHIIEHVLVVGSWMGLVAFLNFQWTLDQGQSIEEARNLTLMLMVLFGNIHALNSRSESRSLFSIPLLGNPFLMLAVPLAQLAHIGAMYTPVLSDVLQIQPISVKEWLQLLAFAMSLLAVEELHKILIRRRQAG